MEPGEPTNVVEALARVTALIGGVPKLNANQRARLGLSAPDEGIKYAYRSIDQLASKAQALFGEMGIIIVPTVLDHEATPVQKGSGTSWYRQLVTVHWDIYGPGGLADRLSAITVGQGDDNSDKGMNKAMTAAFKNLLLRVLCIGDPADETDSLDTRPGSPRVLIPDDLPEGSQEEWDEVRALLTKPAWKKRVQDFGRSRGMTNFNEPGDLTGLLISAARNVLAGREPDEPEIGQAVPAPEAPTPAESAPAPSPSIGVPEHEHTYNKSGSCTFEGCDKEEPF